MFDLALRFLIFSRAYRELLELGQVANCVEVRVGEKILMPSETGIQSLPKNRGRFFGTIRQTQQAHAPKGGARRLFGKITYRLLYQLQGFNVIACGVEGRRFLSEASYQQKTRLVPNEDDRRAAVPPQFIL